MVLLSCPLPARLGKLHKPRSTGPSFLHCHPAPAIMPLLQGVQLQALSFPLQRTGRGTAGVPEIRCRVRPSYKIPWRIQSHCRGYAADVTIARQQHENVLLNSQLIVFFQMEDMAGSQDQGRVCNAHLCLCS